MRAYNETYLEGAMEVLGEAVDYAVNDCGFSIDQFFDMFINSGIAAQFGAGVPKYVVGMSGEELALDTFSASGLTMQVRDPAKHYGRSAEYWVGWILAYYQWYQGIGFDAIIRELPASQIRSLYPALHEASEDKCVDSFNSVIMNNMSAEDTPSSNLQRQRKLRGLSQNELAEKSGVNLRTLQQYEIKTKSINKASVETVLNLSRVLGCKINDILELDLKPAEE